LLTSNELLPNLAINYTDTTDTFYLVTQKRRSIFLGNKFFNK